MKSVDKICYLIKKNVLLNNVIFSDLIPSINVLHAFKTLIVLALAKVSLCFILSKLVPLCLLCTYAFQI